MLNMTQPLLGGVFVLGLVPNLCAPHPVTMNTLPLEQMIACPSCDALYAVQEPGPGARAICGRCRRVLIAPRRGSILHVLVLALGSLVLLLAALVLPFLTISAAGLSHSGSILEIAMALGGPLAPLSLGMAALIVAVPLMRMALLVHVLTPLALDRPAWRGAARAFRWSEQLRPWSMGEIFVVGAGVALMKLGDVARVELGAAAWMLMALMGVAMLQDGFMCRWAIWKAIETSQR